MLGPNMEIPTEIIYRIMLSLSYSDLPSFAQINTEAASICRDDNFWRSKYHRDHGGLNMSAWRRLYSDRYDPAWIVTELRRSLQYSIDKQVLGIYRNRGNAIHRMVEYVCNEAINCDDWAIQPEQHLGYHPDFTLTVGRVAYDKNYTAYPQYQEDLQRYRDEVYAILQRNRSGCMRGNDYELQLTQYYGGIW